MSNPITRRTALAVPVTLPLLPLTAYAAPANATDAAWAAWNVAKANSDANDQAYRAFEASLPVDPRPAYKDFEDNDEFHALADQWEKERAKYPANPFDLDDDASNALNRPVNVAEDEILSAKAATLIDIERKLAVISSWNGWHVIEDDRIDSLLSDVRSLRGVA